MAKRRIIKNNEEINAPLRKEEWVEVLADAIVRAEEKKEEKRNQEIQDLYKTIGVKEYTKNGKPNKFRNWLNQWASFFRLLFISKKKVSGDLVTTSLVSWVLSQFCRLCSVVLWAIALLLTAYAAAYCFGCPVATAWNWLYLIIVFFSVIFAQLFRVASVEAEKMQDKNYMVAILSAVAAVVAIVVSMVV